jgi:hypothetical protein
MRVVYNIYIIYVYIVDHPLSCAFVIQESRDSDVRKPLSVYFLAFIVVCIVLKLNNFADASSYVDSMGGSQFEGKLLRYNRQIPSLIGTLFKLLGGCVCVLMAWHCLM